MKNDPGPPSGPPIEEIAEESGEQVASAVMIEYVCNKHHTVV